jgi:L-lysine exporter family protein LysE/ArgO
MRNISLTRATSRSYGQQVDPTTFVSGFLFSLSLIVAVGAQNAYVLRQGARREHVGTVVVICTVSEVVLIAAGVAGVGTAVSSRPVLLTVARAGGAILLLAYGALAARRALAGAEPPRDAARSGGSRGSVVAATLGFTWLNPAVYLDTLVLQLSALKRRNPDSQLRCVVLHGRGALMACAAVMQDREIDLAGTRCRRCAAAGRRARRARRARGGSADRRRRTGSTTYPLSSDLDAGNREWR